MYYNATAKTASRIRVENLDSVLELQEFANKVEKLGFVDMVVEAFNQDGFVKTINYSYNGESWEKVNLLPDFLIKG